VRAFFVSRNKAGADQLGRLRERFPDAQIEIITGTFEEHIDDARRFARTGRDPFAFLFIDPTGWTGFGLRSITPLLREVRTEVLLNFMTGHISRFVDKGPPNVDPSFVDLFGDASYREAWRGVTGLDREERMVETYCARLAQAGAYRHCVSAVILNPTSDRTHYHLVYGTHSDEGLVVFREIERRGIEFQRAQRADAQQRKEYQRTGQRGLFDGHEIVLRAHEDELRERYLPRALQRLDAMLQTHSEVPWDKLVIEALRVPMVAEADVKQWVKERQAQGVAEVTGLAPHARVPQRGKNHRVRSVVR
jgi:three-Cys-motif partner protein